MFRNLLDFSYRRTPLQAVGFYLAYFLLGVLLMLVGGFLVGIADPSLDFDEGMRLGSFAAVVYVAVLAGLICVAKGFTFALLLLLLAGMGGATLLGFLLGLVPVAVMTSLRGSKPVTTGVEPAVFD